MRRLLPPLALLALAGAGSASPAIAGGDCTAHTTALRYRPAVVFTQLVSARFGTGHVHGVIQVATR